jgi:geranylgeranyl reductase family protein
MARMRPEVAIVGAGPAGAWAAYRLARAGAQVWLFDGSHPREKPCGGGITARALALVAPALEGAPLDAVSIAAAAFQMDGRAPVAVPLDAKGGPCPRLVVASRRAFDLALVEAAVTAGARLIPERVVDVAVDPQGVVLTTRHRAWRVPIVLGADGAASLVRRRVAAPFARRQLSLAAGWYVRGETARWIAIRFLPGWAGYLWSFPRPDHLAVGACAPADSSSPASLRALVREWMSQRGLASSGRAEQYAWPIPTLSPTDFDVERPAGERWMLLGDAAGLVDPITREGIFFALQSAEFAVAALGAPQGAGRRYATQLRDQIYPELRRAAQMARRFFSGAFLPLLMDALAASAQIRAIMADLVAGRQPYRSLKRRLLSTGDWRLAWHLLHLELAGRTR